MGRILAIDYGSKRVGLAVSDPMQIIANNLTTVHSKDVLDYIKGYIKNEVVDCFVVGDPRKLNNKPSESKKLVDAFVNKLKKVFPDIPIKFIDERFTSKIAVESLIMGGVKKKDRRNKELVDKISANLILQSYLEMKDNL